jgi:hypothetical protein
MRQQIKNSVTVQPRLKKILEILNEQHRTDYTSQPDKK